MVSSSVLLFEQSTRASECRVSEKTVPIEPARPQPPSTNVVYATSPSASKHLLPMWRVGDVAVRSIL